MSRREPEKVKNTKKKQAPVTQKFESSEEQKIRTAFKLLNISKDLQKIISTGERDDVCDQLVKNIKVQIMELERVVKTGRNHVHDKEPVNDPLP